MRNLMGSLFLVFGLQSFSLTAAPIPTGGTDFKLAVVDFQAALNGVEEGKQAKSKLKQEFDVKQKDLEKRKTSLDKLQTEIASLQSQMQSGVLKPEAIEKGKKMEADFKKQLEEYSELLQSSQKDISEKEMKATQEIISKLRNLVIELGRNEGYSMVLEKNESGLIYAASYTDLTEKLIQKYNATHKK